MEAVSDLLFNLLGGKNISNAQIWEVGPSLLPPTTESSKLWMVVDSEECNFH